MILSLFWGWISKSAQSCPNSALTKGSLELYQHLQAEQKPFKNFQSETLQLLWWENAADLGFQCNSRDICSCTVSVCAPYVKQGWFWDTARQEMPRKQQRCVGGWRFPRLGCFPGNQCSRNGAWDGCSSFKTCYMKSVPGCV